MVTVVDRANGARFCKTLEDEIKVFYSENEGKRIERARFIGSDMLGRVRCFVYRCDNGLIYLNPVDSEDET